MRTCKDVRVPINVRSTLLRRPLRRVVETCEHARPPLLSNLVAVDQSGFASVEFTDFGVGAGPRWLGIGRV